MTGCQGDPFSTSEAREIARQSRYLQNPWLSRDQLADPISVKQYNLQLKQLTGPVDFDEVGVSIFSQNNEDGILLAIFSKLGMPIKRCVEIGCDLTHSTIGIPEGNSINLIVNFGFDGLIIDVDAEKTSAIRHFFANALATKHFHAPAPSLRDSLHFAPNLVTARVTTDNIDELIRTTCFTGEIDLFSIDIDGEDISVWQSMTACSPRVVIAEINNRIPFDVIHFGGATASKHQAFTSEYQSSYGSSLAAACEVADKKGYTFIGMNSTLINAFFVRNDLRHPDLPAKYPREYLSHRMNPATRTATIGAKNARRLRSQKNMDYWSHRNVRFRACSQLPIERSESLSD